MKIREMLEERQDMTPDQANAWSEGFLAAAIMAVGSCGSLFNSKRDAVEALFSPIAENGEEGEEFVKGILAMLGAEEDTGADDPELSSRCRKAAAKCLEKKGYKILEEGWKAADVVAIDPTGTVVFTTVVTRRFESEMPSDIIGASTRRRLEAAAIEYMAAHEWEDNTPLRFDAITICVNAPNKAILRHHVGFVDGVEGAGEAS